MSTPNIPPSPPDFSARLLAEGVRVHEDALAAPIEEAGADAAARATPGDLEQRIVVRAGALSIAPELRSAFAHLRAGTTVAMLIALIAAIAAGAGSARLVLGSYADGPVNFFLALISLLGLHTLMLLLWLGVIVLRPGSATFGLLGGAVLRLGRRFAAWTHGGPLQLAALQAVGAVAAGSPLGRWTVSMISHAMWLAYLLGCLGIVLLLLGTRQYDFAWETTILSERTYVAVADVIAAPVRALGFPVPDATQVAASRRTGHNDTLPAGRESWGALLVGCLVIYGLLPRAMALLATAAALGRARSRYRLDTTRIGFARLQGRLMPIARPKGIVDPDEAEDSTAAASAAASAPLPIGTTGPTALVGLEIETPAGGWPPPIAGIDWWDLGFVDNRSDRLRVLEQLRTAAVPPRAVLLACSLAQTPDRGTASFVANLRSASPAAVLLLLTHGQRLRTRAHTADAEQRIEDWRSLAEQAGISAARVVDLDLDHLTDDSRARLVRMLGGAVAAETLPPAQHVERAFALILQHARGWSAEPDAAAQAELHRAIARLQDTAGSRWQNLLNVRPLDITRPLQELQGGAQRMVALLPARLRLNPRWLAAGAAAGALACVAASTLIAPVAIASLPAWAGIGAAISALLGPQHRPASAPATVADFGPAVNAAALFALVLALQGRDEATIGRILDRTAGDDEPPLLPDVAAIATWLDSLRARFDAALSVKEGA